MGAFQRKPGTRRNFSARSIRIPPRPRAEADNQEASDMRFPSTAAAARFTLSILAVTLALVSNVSAHHSSAFFDHVNAVTVQGKVTRWQWQSPHSYLFVETKEPGGEVVEWRFEALNPPMLTRHGWTKDSFKFGDQVTVEAY